MRRRTKFQPMAGALALSCASSAAYSAGSASGTVDRNCATFISGPLRPPRIVFRSSACAARSVLMPSIRSPATRAAMPPTAPDVRAKRRSSPNRLLPDMNGAWDESSDRRHDVQYLTPHPDCNPNEPIGSAVLRFVVQGFRDALRIDGDLDPRPLGLQDHDRPRVAVAPAAVQPLGQVR